MPNFALVTGASSGIGRAICIRLAEMGYNILINYNSNLEGANTTKAAVEEFGVQAQLLPFNVGDAEAVRSTLGQWLADNRDQFIEVLVNNAGIRRDNLMVFMKEEEWEQVINTNLNSFFYVTKPLLKNMIAHKKGSIITVSSMSGVRGWKGQVHYSAAKSALFGATKSLAMEVGTKNVRVNAITPGFIKTPMIEGIDENAYKKGVAMERFGTPEEVADLVAFLASDRSTYVNGQIIAVDGGYRPGILK